MLRVQRSANGEIVFTLSGRLDGENIAESEKLFRSEPNGRRIVLDLRDLTLVGQDAVSFLARCETDSIAFKNCPAYIREWITRLSRNAGSIPDQRKERRNGRIRKL